MARIVVPGKADQPDPLRDVWRRAVEEAALPVGTGFRDLRHFYASVLIWSGASVKVVQERLGHSSAVETLDTYSHLFADEEDRSRQAVEDVLGGKCVNSCVSRRGLTNTSPGQKARDGEPASKPR